MTKTGGPAFPALQHPDAWGDEQEGMTLRDYFAARAPVDIPSWFEGPIKVDHSQYPYGGERLTRALEKAAKARFFAWRWHYADAMIAERERTNE